MFSDPGGAKPILSLVSFLTGTGNDYHIISDRKYSFYEDFKLPVHEYNQPTADIIKDFGPDFIFTGTSYTSEIELKFIQQGKAYGIPTYAFVDHWTNIRERFSKTNVEILPDRICLIDSRAKEIAILQGIPESNILVTGNPFHTYLLAWRPSLTRSEFFSSQNLVVGDKGVIVFAPDPLSNVNGIEKFGFDEVQVSVELSELMDRILEQNIFIFKAHPNQSLVRLDPNFLDKVVVANSGIDNNSLIYFSDYVLGFFSNYLIEADLMKKKVLRYLPEGHINDPFLENAIGKVVNKNTLLDQLKHA